MLRVDCDRHWSPSFGYPGACGSSTPNLITGGLVDHMGQPPAVPQAAAVGWIVQGLGQPAPHGVDGVPGDVRGEHDVVKAEQRVVRRYRFDDEDIQYGGAQSA